MVAVAVSEAEKLLIGIWEDLLETEVDREDDFFDLGGYSLLVVDVVERARAVGLAVTSLDVFENPTPAGLAARVAGAGTAEGAEPTGAAAAPGADGSADTGAASRISGLSPGAGPTGAAATPDGEPRAAGFADLVSRVWRTSLSPWDEAAPGTVFPLIAEGADDPLFCFPLGTGGPRLFTELAREIRGDRPVYGIDAVGYRGPVRPMLSLAEAVEYHLRQIRSVQPVGPYRFTGLCAGAVVALEAARRVTADGGDVAALVLVDLPSGMPELDPGWGLTEHYEYTVGMLRVRFGLVDRVGDAAAVLGELKRLAWFEDLAEVEDFQRLLVLWAAAQFAQEQYQPRRYEGAVQVIVPREYEEASRRYWGPFLPEAEFVLTDDVRMVEILKDRRTAAAFRRALGE